MIDVVVRERLMVNMSDALSHILKNSEADLTYPPDKQRVLDIIDQPEKDLTIPNPEYESAVKEHRFWVANGMNQNIRLTDSDLDGTVFFPRGYAKRLVEVWPDVNYIDLRTSCPGLYPDSDPGLRPYQTVAMEAILRAEQGIYMAPPGAGKTVTVLAAMKESGERGIVLTNTTNIAAQWADRCEQFLGFRPGICGDSMWDPDQPITIAMVQAVNYRYDSLLYGTYKFFEKFGFVVVDEMHHAPATTWRKMIESFPARYRIGVSATPDRENGYFPIAMAVIGPVIHETEDTGLIADGHRLRPSVQIVSTKFKHNFYPTGYYKPDGVDMKGPQPRCPVISCKHQKVHLHRTNYSSMVAQLALDRFRNREIVDQIVANPMRRHLVVSNRKSQLHTLQEMLLEESGYVWSVYLMTGAETTSRRMYIAEEAELIPCVILSTIADEALDIPALDTVHLIWPTASIPKVEQQIGRIQRPFEGKKYPLVFDYIDENVSVLRRQANDRRRFYMSKGWKIWG